MVMPPTIIAVAMSRSASIPLPGCHSRDVGEMRLRIRANITTTIGRVPITADTRDIGPISIARYASITDTITKTLPVVIRPIVESLFSRLVSCLMMCGRSEISKRTPAEHRPKSQDIFQNET